MSVEIVGFSEYGEEAVLRLANDIELRTNAGVEGDKVFQCDYVRVVYNGREFGYWDHAEWGREPKIVMGAIMGALSGIQVLPIDGRETR